MLWGLECNLPGAQSLIRITRDCCALPPFYREGTQGAKKLTSLPKVPMSRSRSRAGGSSLSVSGHCFFTHLSLQLEAPRPSAFPGSPPPRHCQILEIRKAQDWQGGSGECPALQAGSHSMDDGGVQKDRLGGAALGMSPGSIKRLLCDPPATFTSPGNSNKPPPGSAWHVAHGNRCLLPFHSEARLGVLIITSENTQSLLSPPPVSQEISLLPKDPCKCRCDLGQ